MDKKLSRIDKIYKYIKDKTERIIKDGNIDEKGIDALSISIDMKLDRTNVSKDINRLWKDGKLIKIQGKPVLYLDYENLAAAYSTKFIPSLIAKGERLSQYLEKSNKEEQNYKKNTYQLDTLIGANGSLREQIIKAKSAVVYPPIGLHTLISGNIGVGKTLFSSSMYNYAVNSGIKSTSSPFITVYCLNYINNSQLFAEQLLGVARGINTFGRTKKGILENCNGGIILLKEVEYLPIESQNLICSIINQKSYSRLGDSNINKLNTMFIATTTASLDSPRIRTIYEYMPISIFLPDISERSIYEKIELILYLFSKEAEEINSTIRVHKDIIVCFANMTYEKNISQLKNEIKIACSRAYLDNITTNYKTVYISFQNLSQDLLSYNENNTEVKSKIVNLLSTIPNEYLVFDTDGYSSAIAYFKTTPAAFTDLSLNQFINEFTVNIEQLDNLDDYVSENISCLKNCADAQLQALKNNIHPLAYQSVILKIQKNKKYESLKNHIYLLYGVLLHITNLLKRIDNQLPITYDKQPSISESLYHEEFVLAKEIYNSFEDIYHCKFSNKEIDFLASYLAVANQWANEANVAILVICHGDNIASDMVSFIKNSIKGDYFIDSIDFNKNLKLNECLNLACLKSKKLNQGAGVLIMSDMEPLTSISEYVINQTGIPSKTIAPVSLPWLIDIVEKSMTPINDIDTLIIHSHAQEISPQQQKIIKDSFIMNITDKIISKTVSFIDAHKAVDTLIVCLNRTLNELSVPYSDEIAVKYLCHCVNMLERVIKNEPWDYTHLNSFINENSYLMHIIEHNLSYAKDTFGIKIPSTELAYITEIFLPFQTVKK